MNITTLRAQIGQSLGYGYAFSTFDGSAAAYAALEADQQVKLTNAMKAYIRANPDDFTPIQQGIAQTPFIETPENYSWGDAIADFSGEVANQAQEAGKAVTCVGQGTLTLLSMARWLIPAAGLAVVGLIAWKYYKGQPLAIVK